ncbi:MAG TPA: transglutaminase family protein [Vineibacter sp.]|nr:transglutaminase family protein [Vineibacter sp.]
MRISIEHKTRYRYAADASYSIQKLRLTPSAFDGQTVGDWRVDCRPGCRLRQSRDGFANTTHLLIINGAHREIEITAGGTVETEDKHGVVQGLPETVPPRVYRRRTPLTEPGEEIEALAAGIPRGKTIPWLHALMQAIHDKVEYLTGETTVETTAVEALKAGKGVCQDHAHIFIAAARAVALPARYVTGYLLTDDTSPAVAHHAWAEVWVDPLGWIGFDVANRVCPTDHYIRLSAALDAHDAAPVRGSRRGGGGETLQVEVVVQRSSGKQ